MKIVFASHNPGKIFELQTALSSFQVEIIPQEKLGVKDQPEIGLTFIENALQKARHAAKETGLPAIGDDSGLEVTVLQGAPGIYSARFSGDNATASKNNDKLLETLKDIPKEKRHARFHCVLVYLTTYDDPTPLICEGSWYGTILTAPQGENGFGYDPLFFDETEQCSAAELPIHKKNKISHRGRALDSLLKRLPEKFIHGDFYARAISQKS